VALGGAIMTAAFEYHSGISGASPTTSNPSAFVAALNTTLLAGMGASAIAFFTSAMRGEKR
jgi:hypothetical protein